MLRFLGRNQLHSSHILFDARFLQYPYLRFISTTSKPTDSTYCSTIDYLVNSCGLSPKEAQSAAQKVNLKSTEVPNSVLNLFKDRGFSKTQITQIISKSPSMLHSCPQKTLKPKINFLQQLGVTGPNLCNFISSDPTILFRGLANQFVPSIEYLKKYLSHDQVITAFKRCTWALRYNLEKVMEPNVAVLRNAAVPESNISKLLLYNPRIFMSRTSRFVEVVDMVKEMGFNPFTMMFAYAIRVMITMSRASWERKLEVYRELGWSEEEVLVMFRKQPICMVYSENKIQTSLDFFLNTLTWKPMQVSTYPVLLSLSLDKRIIPRCAVLGFLKSEGVLSKLHVARALIMNEKQFMEKYVYQYQRKVPDVVKVYEGGIGFSEFEKVGLLKEL